MDNSVLKHNACTRSTGEPRKERETREGKLRRSQTKTLLLIEVSTRVEVRYLYSSVALRKLVLLILLLYRSSCRSLVYVTDTHCPDVSPESRIDYDESQ